MTLALRVVADVFVFVIVAGVGGFFVLVALAELRKWQQRRRDVRTVQSRHPAAGALAPVFDPDDHSDINTHADQGCAHCCVVRASLRCYAGKAEWDRAYVEEIDR